VTKTTVYYPVAGAMRVNGTLYYVLKDHLGSANVITDASGNTVGETRYYAFGETRVTTGTIYTDQLFTGQREMAGLGIYHYGARFYSPKLGRFLSADSMVPNAANPQDFNRYSYVRNNPVRYTDPTGHVCTDPDDPTPSCEGGGSYPNNARPLGGGKVNVAGGKLDPGLTQNKPNKPGNGAGGAGGPALLAPHQDDGFPPTLPDPSLTAPPVDGNYPCSTSYTYTQCYYSGSPLVLNGDVVIDQDQFNLLLIAIYFDLENRAPVSGYDLETRSAYDTPFWDVYGNYPGNLCTNNKCYYRATVNYIAQGMWVAASEQSLGEGKVGVQLWNLTGYRHLADPDELYWFEFGYNNFNTLDPLYSQLMSGYGR